MSNSCFRLLMGKEPVNAMNQLLQTLDQWHLLLIPIIVVLGVVMGSIFYTPFDLRFIPKPRSHMLKIWKFIAVYVMFQMITFIYTHVIPFEKFDVEELRQICYLLGLTGIVLITLLWIVKLTAKKTLHHIVSVIVHLISLFPIYLLLLQDYTNQISDKATLASCLLNFPTIYLILFHYLLNLYHWQRFEIISYGKVDKEQIRDRSLRLLYTLDKQYRLLQDESENQIHYIYDYINDDYEKYEVVPYTKRKQKSRKKRRVPSLPANETAAAYETNADVTVARGETVAASVEDKSAGDSVRQPLLAEQLYDGLTKDLPSRAYRKK